MVRSQAAVPLAGLLGPLAGLSGRPGQTRADGQGSAGSRPASAADARWPLRWPCLWWRWPPGSWSVRGAGAAG
jgi:hypothetical protein